MRRLALIVALASLAVALVAAPPGRSSGPSLRDFEAYYTAGQTWHYGGDAYGRDVWRTEKDVPGVVASRDELLPFVGPPFGLPLWDALGRLSWQTATFVWASVLGVAFVTIVLGSLVFGRERSRLTDALAAATFAAAFAPLTGGIALGQVAIVACAAIVAMPMALRPRGTLAAAALAFVSALQPNLAIVLAARLAESRTWIAFVSAALVAAGASALALGGPQSFARYAGVLRAQGDAERFIAIQSTPGAVARAFGASPEVASFVAGAIALAAIAALVAQASRRTVAPAMRLVLACALVPVAIPFAHEHDLTIAFLPALVLVLRARGGAWAGGALAAVALAVDWIGLAQRPATLGAEIALATTAACATIALAREPLRAFHLVPLAIVPLVALLGVLAAGHLMPTWPDALPVDFRAPIHASAADVWRGEQVRAGLAALDPLWGLLRAIPLAACVAIWALASRFATSRERLRADAR